MTLDRLRDWQVYMLVLALFLVGCSGSDKATDGPADLGDSDVADEADDLTPPADDMDDSAPPSGDGTDPAPPVAKTMDPLDLETPTVELADQRVSERQPVADLKASEGGIEGVAFSPDGTTLYATNEKLGVIVIDANTYEQTATWPAPPKPIESFELSADGSVLVTAHADSVLRTWSTETGSELATFDAHQQDIVTLAISPDGKTVVSSEEVEIEAPNEYVAWDAATGKEKWRRPSQWRDTKPVAFSPDGKSVALWGDEATQAVVICDAENGEPQREIKLKQDNIAHLAYAPDGNSLLVAVKVRRERKRRILLALIGLDDASPRWIAETGSGLCNDLAFSPDGAVIACAGQSTHLFNAGDGALLFSLKKNQLLVVNEHFSFSPDGKRLATLKGTKQYKVFETSPEP